MVKFPKRVFVDSKREKDTSRYDPKVNREGSPREKKKINIDSNLDTNFRGETEVEKNKGGVRGGRGPLRRKWRKMAYTVAKKEPQTKVIH